MKRREMIRASMVGGIVAALPSLGRAGPLADARPREGGAQDLYVARPVTEKDFAGSEPEIYLEIMRSMRRFCEVSGGRVSGKMEIEFFSSSIFDPNKKLWIPEWEEPLTVSAREFRRRPSVLCRARQYRRLRFLKRRHPDRVFFAPTNDSPWAYTGPPEYSYAAIQYVKVWFPWVAPERNSDGPKRTL